MAIAAAAASIPVNVVQNPIECISPPTLQELCYAKIINLLPTVYRVNEIVIPNRCTYPYNLTDTTTRPLPNFIREYILENFTQLLQFPNITVDDFSLDENICFTQLPEFLEYGAYYTKEFIGICRSNPSIRNIFFMPSLPCHITRRSFVKNVDGVELRYHVCKLCGQAGGILDGNTYLMYEHITFNRETGDETFEIFKRLFDFVMDPRCWCQLCGLIFITSIKPSWECRSWLGDFVHRQCERCGPGEENFNCVECRNNIYNNTIFYTR